MNMPMMPPMPERDQAMAGMPPGIPPGMPIEMLIRMLMRQQNQMPPPGEQNELLQAILQGLQGPPTPEAVPQMPGPPMPMPRGGY